MAQTQTKLLTKQKYAWAKNRDVTLRGLPLAPNVGVEQRYAAKLRKMTKVMTDAAERDIIRLFNKPYVKEFFGVFDESVASQSDMLLKSLRERFDKLFASSARDIADDMVDDNLKSSTSSLRTSLKVLSGGLLLKTSVITKDLEEVLKARINENVSLIKSIPREYLDKVSQAVTKSITTGSGLAGLVPELMKLGGITERRAKNIALDQARKAYGNITELKMRAVGITDFKWLHTGLGRQHRKSHKAISGQVFSLNDLPLKGEEGFTNGQMPSWAINCYCLAIPVIRFGGGK